MSTPKETQSELDAAMTRMTVLRQESELKRVFDAQEKERKELVEKDEFKKADIAEKEFLARQLFAKHELAKQDLFERQQRDKEAFQELKAQRDRLEHLQGRDEGRLLHRIELEKQREPELSPPVREPVFEKVGWEQAKKAEQVNYDRQLKQLDEKQQEFLAKKMKQAEKEGAGAEEKNEMRRELEKAFEKQRQEEMNRQRDRLAGMEMIYRPLGRGY